MGATELTFPVRVRAIAPEAVADVRAWAERQRAHLRALRDERDAVLERAVVAEAAADATGHGCPPEFAGAVDAMLSAAMDRLDGSVAAAKRDAVRHVAGALRQGNARRSAAGCAPDLRPDGAWEDRLLALTLRRPRSAIELWRSTPLAVGPPFAGAQPTEVEDDTFDRFWQGVEDGPRRLIRRQPEGTRS